MLVATMADNAGAIRFYRRCGWERLVREQKGWPRIPSQPADRPLSMGSGSSSLGASPCRDGTCFTSTPPITAMT